MPRTSSARLVLHAIVLVALAGAAPHADAGQAARQQQLDVIVVDRNQNPVTDLTPAEFVVREDGVAREVISVTAGAPPSPIMLLVDNSQAAEPSLLDIRRGLAAFVDAFGATSVQIGLKTFGERPTTVAAPTSPAMVRIGRTVMPGRFMGQITHDNALDILSAVGSVRTNSS